MADDIFCDHLTAGWMEECATTPLSVLVPPLTFPKNRRGLHAPGPRVHSASVRQQQSFTPV